MNYDYTIHRLEQLDRALQLLRAQIGISYHPEDAVERKLANCEAEVKMVKQSIQKESK